MRIFPGNHPSTSIATAAVAHGEIAVPTAPGHICGAWPGPLSSDVGSPGTGGEVRMESERQARGARGLHAPGSAVDDASFFAWRVMVTVLAN